MPNSSKTVLVVGASRGLGLALAGEFFQRGWRIIATARGAAPALRALAAASGGRLEVETVDINAPDQVGALRGRLAARRIDLLFVNAGVTNDDRETAGDVSTEEFTRVMVTNALSPMRVVEAFCPLVPDSGALAVMSSGQGSVGNNETGGHEGFAARHAGDKRTLLLLAPGWARTELGGPEARLGVEESIPKLVDVIAAREGKGGLHYVDYLGRTVPAVVTWAQSLIGISYCVPFPEVASCLP